MKCKFNIPSGHKRAIWEITNRCNYNCIYCIFSANHSQKEATTSQCLHIVDELVANGFTQLKLTGGEPFIREDMLTILRYACQHLEVDISTNGAYLTPAVCQELATLKLKQIHISLDGLKAEHEFLRGPGTYHKTITGIHNAVKAGLKVRLGTVLYKGNEHQLREIVNKAYELHVNEIVFSMLEPVGKLNGNTSLNATRTKADIAEQLKRLRFYTNRVNVAYNWDSHTYSPRCKAGTDFIYVNHLGQIAPCTWIAAEQPNCMSKKSLAKDSLNNLMQSLPTYNPCRYCEN